MISRIYGGKPIAAEFILSKKRIPEPKDPHEVLSTAGIQDSFSTIARERPSIKRMTK